jgi:hypothetical protein
MKLPSLTRPVVVALAIVAAGATAIPLGVSAAKIKDAATSYTYNYYQYPHDNFTQLLGINNGSRIAGYHNATVFKGFKFRLPHNIQNWNYPHSAQTQVIGINNLGDTVGFYIDAKGVTHGWFNNHTTARWVSVDVPGTTFNQVLGVNDMRQAVGYYQYGAANIFQPFIWGASGTFILIPIHNAQATDINNSDVVTGFQVVSSTDNRAFVINHNQTSYFHYPGSNFTQALGVNNKGTVVGTYNDKHGVAHGFTYSLITHAFHSVSASHSSSTVINGINDGGRLVGFYTPTGKNPPTIGLVATPKK